MLHETMIAVSRFAYFPLFALLAGHSIAACMPHHSHAQIRTLFSFFPVGFQGKERELAVYQHSCVVRATDNSNSILGSSPSFHARLAPGFHSVMFSSRVTCIYGLA